jgi:hypothetical protein
MRPYLTFVKSVLMFSNALLDRADVIYIKVSAPRSKETGHHALNLQIADQPKSFEDYVIGKC